MGILPEPPARAPEDQAARIAAQQTSVARTSPIRDERKALAPSAGSARLTGPSLGLLRSPAGSPEARIWRGKAPLAPISHRLPRWRSEQADSPAWPERRQL